jgi:hypothetical protein
MREMPFIKRDTVDKELAILAADKNSHNTAVDLAFNSENPFLKELIIGITNEYTQKHWDYYASECDEKKDFELIKNGIIIGKPYFEKTCFLNDSLEWHSANLSASCCARSIYEGTLSFYDAIRMEFPFKGKENYPEFREVPFVSPDSVRNKIIPYLQDIRIAAPGTSLLEVFADGVWDRIRRQNLELERLVAILTVNKDIVVTEGIYQNTAIVYHLLYENFPGFTPEQKQLF